MRQVLKYVIYSEINYLFCGFFFFSIFTVNPDNFKKK